MLRSHPLPWVFSIWAVAIGAGILPNLLDAPHYRYLMTIPGGFYSLGTAYVLLGLIMFGTLVGRRDAAFRATLAVLGLLSIIVALLLAVASFMVEHAVNLGPLTWGGMGVVSIVYALGQDNG